MRLKYSILWFEDKEDYYDIASKDIIEYLEDLGYVPDLERKTDSVDLIKKINEKDVDLMLVDYNLNETLKGDQLVSIVRNNELYTEAIFYAQNPSDLKKIRGYYDGVFSTTRNGLIEKAQKIINLTLKKSRDFGNIRGLFIAETIDLTKQLEQIISKILQLQEEQSEFFLCEIAQLPEFSDYSKFRIISSFLRNKQSSLNKKYEKMNPGPERDQFKKEVDSIQEFYSIFKDYFRDVIDVRNSLAHGKPTTKNCLMWKGKECLYDEENCTDIRSKFLKHAENLKNIFSLLCTS